MAEAKKHKPKTRMSRSADRDYFGPRFLWQFDQHLGDRFANDRVTPIRRHFGKRDEDKSAILHPRVRQDELVWRILLLTLGIE